MYVLKGFLELRSREVIEFAMSSRFHSGSSQNILFDGSMSDPTPTSFLPGKTERRNFGSGQKLTPPEDLPIVQVFDDPRLRAPIAQAQSRYYLISVLDRQFQIAQEQKYQLCLALVTLETTGETIPLAPTAVLNTVAKICRANLRPTDLVYRLPDSNADEMLALVLLESDETGGASVAARLKRSLDRRLYFGKTSLRVRPVFAISDCAFGFGSAGKSLFTTAEMVLKKASFEKSDIAVASSTLAPLTVDNVVQTQSIANAITGMFEPPFQT